MPNSEVVSTLVIGAGPFGLSTSAHLRARGIEHRLVGRSVDTWRNHMPVGMMLRSEPYGSDISAPAGGYDVGTYSREHGRPYVERLGPLSREHWLDYADEFARRYPVEAEDLVVTDVTPVDGGFVVTFEGDAAPCRARQVVVATGVAPYAVLPPVLDSLPRDLVTHSIDHDDLSRYAGRRVAVIGGGQSAMETTALLHEGGAEVTAVVRRSAVNWLRPNPATISGLEHLTHPVNKLCEGWHCAFWNTPRLFRMLPEQTRLAKAKSVLGPAGAWWLKDRVQGVVPLLTGHEVVQVEALGSGVRLHLRGEQDSLDVDHVICATGFKVDLTRLGFLPQPVRDQIATLGGYPVLSRSGESTVPGLFFAGAPAAASLGPSTRFIAGTHTSVPQLAARLARGGRAARQPATVVVPGPRVPEAAPVQRPDDAAPTSAASV